MTWFRMARLWFLVLAATTFGVWIGRSEVIDAGDWRTTLALVGCELLLGLCVCFEVLEAIAERRGCHKEG